MKKSFRAHPLMTLRLMRPFLFVLILPLIKGAVQYIAYGEISGILALEALTLAAIATAAFMKSRLYTIDVEKTAITIKNGLFFRTRSDIAFGSIASVTANRNLFDLLCKTATVCINTEAGKKNKPDFRFKLAVDDVRALLKFIYGDKESGAITFSPIKISIMAATTSSAVMGLIIGVPIINNLGKLLGVGLSDMLIREIDNASHSFNTYFPPIVNAVTLVFIIGYAISFGVSLFKYMRFRIFSDENRLEVRSGIFVLRRSVFKKSAINDICIEQRPLMRFFGMFSVRAAVAGYGNEKGEKAVIVPCGNRRDITRQLSAYFIRTQSGRPYIRAAQTALERRRFLALPIICEIIVIALTAAAILIFPYFDRLIIFIGLVLSGIVLYYADLCRYCHKAGRISFGDIICARGSFWLVWRELYCEKQKAGIIKLVTTPEDRRMRTCKLKITVRSESADRIRVKNLDLEEIKREIKETFGVNV